MAPAHSLSRLMCLLAIVVLAALPAAPATAANPAGLVGHWGFDEASGTVTADQGPNDLDGTLLGGAQFSQGVLGGGVQLDGLDDYVDITTAGDSFPSVVGDLSEGTISLWFSFDRLTGPNEVFTMFYLGDGTEGTSQDSLVVEIGHFNAVNSTLYFTVYDDAVPSLCFDTVVTNPLNTDQWYHFAVTVGPGGNTGYLNGQELFDRHYNFGDASGTEFLGAVDEKQEMWVGNGYLAHILDQQFFSGGVDEVLVYDRVLSAAEVSDYYQSVLNADGDLDDDGDVDADDVDLLRANLGDAAYDLDGDGIADEDDLIHLIETLVAYDTDGDGTPDGVGTFRGDFNLDGTVNGTDLSIMNGNFGTAGGYAAGNANADSTINGTDLSILAAAFGNTATAAIPEPASLALLLTGAAALLRKRRRHA